MTEIAMGGPLRTADECTFVGGVLPPLAKRRMKMMSMYTPEEWQAYAQKYSNLKHAIKKLLEHTDEARALALRHGSLSALVPGIDSKLCFLGHFPNKKLGEILRHL